MTVLREQNLSKLGFRFGLNGPHAARTMMLARPALVALRRLWPLDSPAQPVLALALARDPLLPASVQGRAHQ